MPQRLDRNANDKTRLRRNAQKMRTEALYALAEGGGLGVDGDSQLLVVLDGVTLRLTDDGLSVNDAGIGSTQLGILTTKGDLLVFGTAADRLPVGADTYVLMADSAEPLGVKWNPRSIPLDPNGGLEDGGGDYGIKLENASLFLGPSGLSIAPDGVGATELGILTTKGDLIGFSTLPEKVSVGSNAQILVADSGATCGVAWETRDRLVWNEVPVGLINGLNVTFVLANAPITGHHQVFVNGLLKTPTLDYTVAGATITFTVAPVALGVLLVTYGY